MCCYTPPFFCGGLAAQTVFWRITSPLKRRFLLPEGWLEGVGVENEICFSAAEAAVWMRGSKLKIHTCFVMTLKRRKNLLEPGPGGKGGWVENIMLATFCRGRRGAPDKVTWTNITHTHTHTHTSYDNDYLSLVSRQISL